MMNNISLDIIIPVYNGVETIAQCLDSILEQERVDGVDLGVIVVNDASTDGSGVLLDAYGDKHDAISVVHNDQNSGRSQTVNNGVRASKAQYVGIIDCDCYWEAPTILRQVISQFRNDKKVVFGFTKSNGTGFWSAYANHVHSARKGQDLMNQTTANFFMERPLFIESGMFSEAYQYYGFEDKDFIANLAIKVSDAEVSIDRDCIAIHLLNDMTVNNMTKKFYDAGKYSSKVIHQHQPAYYASSNYRLIDIDFSPMHFKLILSVLAKFKKPLSRFAESVTTLNVPYKLKLALVRAAISAYYFDGTRDRA